MVNVRLSVENYSRMRNNVYLCKSKKPMQRDLQSDRFLCLKLMLAV